MRKENKNKTFKDTDFGRRDSNFYESMPMAGKDNTETKGRNWAYWIIGALVLLMALFLLAGFDLDLSGGGFNINAPSVQTPETP